MKRSVKKVYAFLCMIDMLIMLIPSMAFAAETGEECEALSDNDGWYYVWVPDWANHIIVNANEGSVQTLELIPEGKDAWISVQDADHADISY